MQVKAEHSLADEVFTLKIPTTSTILPHKGSAYTDYNMEITVGSEKWRVGHRYSDILAFHNALKKEMDDASIMPSFPPKKRGIPKQAQKKPKFIENRRIQLEKYFDHLIPALKYTKPELLQLPIVTKFVGLDGSGRIETEDESLDDIFALVSKGDAVAVESLIRKFSILRDKLNAHGNTPLHIAVEKKHEDVTDVLLKMNASVNAPDDIRWTPLHTACASGNINILHSILNTPEVDINAITQGGQTLLHCLSKGFKSKEQVRDLEEEFANLMRKEHTDINARNERGETPLHTAVLENNVHILKLLITYNAELNAQESKLGETPLHFAARMGNPDTVEFLILAGADPEIPCRDTMGSSAISHEVVQRAVLIRKRLQRRSQLSLKLGIPEEVLARAGETKGISKSSPALRRVVSQPAIYGRGREIVTQSTRRGGGERGRGRGGGRFSPPVSLTSSTSSTSSISSISSFRDSGGSVGSYETSFFTSSQMHALKDVEKALETLDIDSLSNT